MLMETNLFKLWTSLNSFDLRPKIMFRATKGKFNWLCNQQQAFEEVTKRVVVTECRLSRVTVNQNDRNVQNRWKYQHSANRRRGGVKRPRCVPYERSLIGLIAVVFTEYWKIHKSFKLHLQLDKGYKNSSWFAERILYSFKGSPKVWSPWTFFETFLHIQFSCLLSQFTPKESFKTSSSFVSLKHSARIHHCTSHFPFQSWVAACINPDISRNGKLNQCKGIKRAWKKKMIFIPCRWLRFSSQFFPCGRDFFSNFPFIAALLRFSPLLINKTPRTTPFCAPNRLRFAANAFHLAIKEKSELAKSREENLCNFNILINKSLATHRPYLWFPSWSCFDPDDDIRAGCEWEFRTWWCGWTEGNKLVGENLL